MMRSAVVVLVGLLVASCSDSEEAPKAPTTPSSMSTTPAPPSKPDADGGSAADPNAAKTLDGYLGTLPEPPKGELRSTIVDAILRTCEVFAPTSNASFTREHCWAHLAASAAKESTFTPTLISEDGYGKRSIGGQKADDPTVGLTQIRFSSAVHDVVQFGKLESLARVGCTLPQSILDHASEPGDSSFWAVVGPRQNLATMQSVQCNLAIGAWNYYVPATGNGNASKPTYSFEYCTGKGVGANLVTGMRSYLKGPSGGNGVIMSMAGIDALKTSDNYAYEYISQIKTWFDAMVSPNQAQHPFFQVLAPEPTRYCK